MKLLQRSVASEDEISSCSLSSESLQFEDVTRTNASAVESSHSSFDVTTVALDQQELTDDELDIETSPQDIAPKELLVIRELTQLRGRRFVVISTFLLSMGATGSLTYFYLNETLPHVEDEWMCPLIMVALYMLPVVAVLWYDYGSRIVIEKLRKTATNNTAIVNSLFPENVRSRMLKAQSRRITQEEKRGGSVISSQRRNRKNRDQTQQGMNGSHDSLGGILSLGSRENRKQRRKVKRRLRRASHRLESFAAIPANQTLETAATETTTASFTESAPDDKDEILIPKDILAVKPIADFFPHCTVLFADIVGFTAWSSVREPTAVFTLLESLYSCFDRIARRLRVFKVETIGDCYVAATGLPEPMDNHAVVMAQFARSCMSKMMQIVRVLETHLGPDTGDLSMRFGLHRCVLNVRLSSQLKYVVTHVFLLFGLVQTVAQ